MYVFVLFDVSFQLVLSDGKCLCILAALLTEVGEKHLNLCFMILFLFYWEKKH